LLETNLKYIPNATKEGKKNWYKLMEVFSLKEEFIKNLHKINSDRVGIAEERNDLENSWEQLNFIIKSARERSLRI
jgi:hypothetical protein